jgi:hydroxyacylglutathione hydrolase
MILKQYYLGCLSQASYLIGDETTGDAVLIDPRRDVDLYLEEAKQLGVKIRHVLLTHFHADFVSGHLELRKATGADIRMGKKANPEYPFVPMQDGDVLEIGRHRIRVLETPGHTPESVCYLLFETALKNSEPSAIFTGDTLFIGDVGRPDLMASEGVSAETLARQLYDSIREKILPLPDAVIIYPGHGAGSMCGKNLSAETSSPLGDERRLNPMLRPDLSRDAFVAMVTADQPAAPAYFAYDAWYNRQDRVTLDENLARVVVPLGFDNVRQFQKEGAQLLDTRDPNDYAKRHLVGSINIGLEGTFATWAGTLLDREKPVVLIAEPGHEKEAALRLGRIGFDKVLGFLPKGPDAPGIPAEAMRSVERVTAAELAKLMSSTKPPLVLDVRGPGEREALHLAGSLHIPLPELGRRFSEVPKGREIVVHCAGGYRSSMAASMLRNQGFTPVEDLIGGIRAWEDEGLPLAAPARV